MTHKPTPYPPPPPDPQIVHSLGRLGRSVCDVLPPGPLVDLAAQLLGRMCESLVADILAKR